MQVVCDFAHLKMVHGTVPIGKIIYANLKELARNQEYRFDEEIKNFTKLREEIVMMQHKGMNGNLLKLYKEYLFYFETFRKKNLLKEKTKLLWSNDAFNEYKRVEYEFEREHILIIFNIGLVAATLLKMKKNSEDVKMLNRMSNDVVEIFNYLFVNMNGEKMPELPDINCVTCYVFLCISMAYHENMFYNTALVKKYKRKLLAKLSFNIHCHFKNALTCLEGKELHLFFRNPSKVSSSPEIKSNLHRIRSSSSPFYNFLQVNKIIFICISNFHTALKHATVHSESLDDSLKIEKYEVDKIGEIICRLKYSQENVQRCADLCKRYNFNINLSSLRGKIDTALDYFEYENRNIYFEVIPSYESLGEIKGTSEVIKLKEIDVSSIYTKKDTISCSLKLLFNEKAELVYNLYNNEAIAVYGTFYKNFLSLRDQYNLINLSCRKNVLLILHNVIISTYNKITNLHRPTHFENNLTFLQNVEQNLKEILTQVESSLTAEHTNHVEFQRKFLNVGINQESVNSYNSFLYHLNVFKKSLEEIHSGVESFRLFLQDNHMHFQICQMDVSTFAKYIVDDLNTCTSVNIESLDHEYVHYKNLLSEDRHSETNSVSSVGDLSELAPGMIPSLNYFDFHAFLKSHNLTYGAQNGNAANQKNLFHFDAVNNYINVHSEEKLFFVILAIYFSLSIQLAAFGAELEELKSSMHDVFLNSISEERDEDRLNDLLQKQKVALSAKKAKLEESLASFEKNLNQFYDYFHEYNKLDYFKTIEDLNAFTNNLMGTVEKLNEMNKKHSYTLKNSLVFKDDINRYIYMRESERSTIRVQQIPNGYSQNIHNSHERFY
ncbi:BRO1 domain-containing protein, putative [Plasmodium vivax]|uniref:BRO1 domain-containing protein, putative n=1 Tax=Plasmodium vivax TaxID=5855 RepID=A0A565A396_PLAVI|nr:BRO1 domain-containing protein, putative [Plasmodium vivax]